MPRRKVFKQTPDEEPSILFEGNPENGESKDDASVEEEETVYADDVIADSDSDEAPDDVAFSAGKEDALLQVQAVLKQMEQENRSKKLKRRQRDELFKQQKQQKLQELADRRLPDDFLADLSSQPITKKPAKILKKDDQVESPDVEAAKLSDEADDEAESEDYIPLGNDRLTNFKVVAIKEDLKKGKLSSQTAAEFRQNMLFGDRVKREPMQAKMAKKLKKKAQFRS